MRTLVAFFVDRPLLVHFITLAVLAFGAIVAWSTPRALLPDEQTRQIEVIAELPGASALDIERLVTFRLEEALQGMEDVEQLDSTTTNGRAHLSVTFEPEVHDLTRVQEQIRSRLSAVQHRLPRDLRPLRIHKRGRRSNQWMMELLIEHADPADPTHRVAIEALQERLRRVPNVVDVQSDLPELDLYIRFSRTALQRHEISVVAARERIQAFLQPSALGAVEVRDQQIAVALADPFVDLDALRALPLRVNRAGLGVSLGDVATVELGFEAEQERMLLDGQRFVELKVVNSLGADTIEISERVRQVLDAQDLLPPPVTLRIGRDASQIIDHELDTLLANGLGGILLVGVLLYAFLGGRVGAMTALGLPFCYLGVTLLLPVLGVSLNLISLVALILVVGILVDDAIIVSEEYCQHRAAGAEPRDAAIDSVLAVSRPVLGMAVTTTLAFVPLLVIQQDSSWLFRPLPIVIIAAIGLSVFESFFLLPSHLQHFAGTALPERRFVVHARTAYTAVLRALLRMRYGSILVPVALLGAAVYLLTGPVAFHSDFNMNGEAVVYVELQEPAESLDELAAQVALVEDVVAELGPEWVGYVKSQLGSGWTWGGSNVEGWQYAMLYIIPPGEFVEQEERRKVVEERLRERLPELEGDVFRRVRLAIEAGGRTRDVITVYVSGGDRIGFTEVQDAVRDAVQSVDSVQDIRMDASRFQRSLQFAIDDRAALAYGLDRARIAEQLREHVSRHDLLRIRQRGEELDVYLRFADEVQPDPAALSELTVLTDRGISVPLRLLGRWTEHQVVRRIRHQDLLRTFQIDVLYDHEQVEADAVVEGIEAALAPVREAYDGYHVSVEPSEDEEEARRWVVALLVAGIGLIYGCLALSLDSLLAPLVVLFAVPFGFIGVVFAFWLHGQDLGVMAVIGLLGLAGVVVNDALVMVSTVTDAVRTGGDATEAVLEGAARRFRAVVLTSLTTLAGVFPLAYGLAGSAGWLQPMVLAVGWGLLFATVLTLFFLPCLLMIGVDGGRAWRWVRRRAPGAP